VGGEANNVNWWPPDTLVLVSPETLSKGQAGILAVSLLLVSITLNKLVYRRISSSSNNVSNMFF
jgi:hypothetical protein